MATAYQIKNWELYFENAESRKVKNATWVALPNKHDGKGYARVARHKKSCRVLAGWTLILQVASKCPQRGLLVDEDGALDADDLADMTRFPASVFEDTFEVLTHPSIDWIEIVEIPDELVSQGRKPDKIPVRPDASGSVRTCPGRTEQKGTEGNGTEQKGRGGNTRARAPARPTQEEVVAYCQSLGLTADDGTYIFFNWEDNDWKNTNTKKPIKDWKRTAQKWKAASYFPSQKGNGGRSTRQQKAQEGTYSMSPEAIQAMVRNPGE